MSRLKSQLVVDTTFSTIQFPPVVFVYAERMTSAPWAVTEASLWAQRALLVSRRILLLLASMHILTSA